MQKYKKDFSNPSVRKTFGNVQSCIRVDDLEEVGDSSHLVHFQMLGLFSMREWTVKQTIDFWMSYLDKISVKIDTVTIHPDRFNDWESYYSDYEVTVTTDPECVWSDGSIGGYCTEFYVGDLEIGNIVNTNGDSIDVGFGLERLTTLTDPTFTIDEKTTLVSSVEKIIASGFKPGPKKQEYVLRKLLRLCYNKGYRVDHQFYDDEVSRQKRLVKLYNRLKEKHSDKSPEWWFDTHGINVNEF